MERLFHRPILNAPRRRRVRGVNFGVESTWRCTPNVVTAVAKSQVRNRQKRGHRTGLSVKLTIDYLDRCLISYLDHSQHAFSQIVDWFYNLEDFKNTQGFSATFGPGHTSFTALMVMGRSASLDDIKRSRLRWRTDTVLIGKHKVICITFDELHAVLQRKFHRYSAGSKVEATTEAPGLPPPQDSK